MSNVFLVYLEGHDLDMTFLSSFQLMQARRTTADLGQRMMCCVTVKKVTLAVHLGFVIVNNFSDVYLCDVLCFM